MPKKIDLPDGVFSGYHVELAERFLGVEKWEFGKGSTCSRDGFTMSAYGVNKNGTPVIDVMFTSSGNVTMHDIREMEVDFGQHISMTKGVRKKNK